MARERNNKIGFYVNDKEKELIDYKFNLSNLFRGKFYRKMIIDGGLYIKDIEWEKEKFNDIRALTYELNRIGNNINQVAKLCNETKKVDYRDIEILRSKLDEIYKAIKPVFKEKFYK
jgi:hypothetical protein